MEAKFPDLDIGEKYNGVYSFKSLAKKMPKVSVVIPTCNRAHFLVDAINSVSNQTFKSVEIIVIDDGSVDRTKEILEKYGSSIHYIFQDNKGRSVARNTGINAAKGEYIAFLDDDDIWLPEKLEKQVAFLDTHPEIGLVHAFIELMDEYGRPLPEETKKQRKSYRMAIRSGYNYQGMSRLCAMYTSTVLLRKECLNKVGFFDPDMKAFEDWDFYLRFALKYNIGTILESLVRFRIHKAHSTQNEFIESRIKLSLKHLAIMQSFDNSPFRKRVCCNFYMHLANTYYIAMDIVSARKYIVEALKLKPFVLFWPNFEFRLLAALLFPRLTNKLRGRNLYPERIVPNETSGGALATHLKRYEFVKQFCKDKLVLDAACGAGYGSNYLADSAKVVVGLDISREAIAYAKKYYQRKNTHFETADIHNLNFPGGYFDTVCSFETLEHLDEPLKFIFEIKRVLKENGVFIISTPYAKKTSYTPKNPFHKAEFSPGDLEYLLGKYFKKVEIYGQRRTQSLAHYCLQRIDIFHLRAKLPGLLRKKICHALGSRSWDEAGLEDFTITKDKIKHALALIGVCKA